MYEEELVKIWALLYGGWPFIDPLKIGFHMRVKPEQDAELMQQYNTLLYSRLKTTSIISQQKGHHIIVSMYLMHHFDLGPRAAGRALHDVNIFLEEDLLICFDVWAQGRICRIRNGVTDCPELSVWHMSQTTGHRQCQTCSNLLENALEMLGNGWPLGRVCKKNKQTPLPSIEPATSGAANTLHINWKPVFPNMWLLGDPACMISFC